MSYNGEETLLYIYLEVFIMTKYRITVKRNGNPVASRRLTKFDHNWFGLYDFCWLTVKESDMQDFIGFCIVMNYDMCITE
jgi:hypothetical protein